ncbi:Toll/interleukin-1 receptor homology (TIR) domain [Dillenia turbinata]|uniref:Toll/interleukin-1 receptor homology (TIR) domain n=1 Tax=Dillenia turbinata TaxID=194707 RepID=A0AAN8WBJ2_9MAGN
MHRAASAMKNLQKQLLANPNSGQFNVLKRVTAQPSCDVFINHRGADTKRSMAALLYDHLARLKLRPFLDNRTMKPGDKLFDSIHNAIRGCKVGVTVFSPRYCESYFCLHELSLLVESRKKIIPIFYDINPSDICNLDNVNCSEKDFLRFSKALVEARYTVGLTFDSSKGNWSEVVTKAADTVIKSLMEAEGEK